MMRLDEREEANRYGAVGNCVVNAGEMVGYFASLRGRIESGFEPDVVSIRPEPFRPDNQSEGPAI